MTVKSTRKTWGLISRWLHWASAVVIIFGLTHGYWMANFLPRQQRLWHYWLHSLVFIYFALLLVGRVAWRLSEETPEQPPGSAVWESVAARVGHLSLYLVLIAVMVTGYMNWSAFPVRLDPNRAAQMELSFFGLFNVPGVHATADRAVFQFWERAHMYLSWTLMALVLVHVAAALRHHFYKGNDVMRRMWTGKV